MVLTFIIFDIDTREKGTYFIVFGPIYVKGGFIVTISDPDLFMYLMHQRQFCHSIPHRRTTQTANFGLCLAYSFC